MFYESLTILNISTLNFSEGVPASVLIGLAFLSSNFCKMLMHYFLIVSVGTWFPSSLHIFYIRFNIRPTGECLKPQSSKLSTSGYSNGVRPYEEFFTISTSFNQWSVIRKISVHSEYFIVLS